MKTIAVFFADGFEDIEGLSPVDYLRRARLNVITVAVPSETMTDKNIVKTSHNVRLFADMTFDEYMNKYSKELPDAVVCPGGSTGADNLAATPTLLEHLENCFKAGKIVAANCASPAVVFGKTNILKGKKWTCYPGMQELVSEDLLKGYANKTFITDGTLVTARGPGASEEFSMELVRLLAGQEAFDNIRSGGQLR